MAEATQPQQLDTVPQEIIEQVARQVFAIERGSLIQMYCLVGKAVLDGLFGGDFGNWNARNVGETALPRLAETLKQQQAGWTEWRIYRAVRIHEQQVALGGFERWPTLTATHLQAVHGVPWDKQRELLDAAQANRQPVRELQKAANLARGIAPRTEKKTAADEAQQVLRRFESLIGEREELAVDLGALGVAEDSIRGFESVLDQLRVAVEALRAEVREAAKREPE